MDERAKRILLRTFWDGGGWRFDCLGVKEMIAAGYLSAADFSYAREKGVMFEPITMAHDECLRRLLSAAEGISPSAVAAAFLCSLSGGRTEWRSALSSRAVAKRLRFHPFSPCDGGSGLPSYCEVCNQERVSGMEEYRGEDLNVLAFERVKWGGVRHEHLLYCMFDLERFLSWKREEPTKQDREIFQTILAQARSCRPLDGPRQLEARLRGLFPSNRSQRDSLIEILAQAGILAPKKSRPARGGKNDWAAAGDWRGEDGVDGEALSAWFGDYL